ncbi:hypothetical protein PUN28_017267 [Cardiocondyla obscurior]|uniref:Uncharacterized protein n=1 Tax=Cardiocondyla obscurior TaxID=286306 RepID=A0AAW2EQA7_9HYME
MKTGSVRRNGTGSIETSAELIAGSLITRLDLARKRSWQRVTRSIQFYTPTFRKAQLSNATVRYSTCNVLPDRSSTFAHSVALQVLRCMYTATSYLEMLYRI